MLLDFARELKKKKQLWNMKVTLMPIVIVALDIIPEGLVKELEDFGNKRIRGDHLNKSVINIGQNTENSPRDLARAAT